MKINVIKSSLERKAYKKKVCAYARVSTDNESQEDSLDNQIEYYKKLIMNNEEYEFIGVFADKGISGFTDKRPEFQNMITLARTGKIDLIITKSISRFARNTAIVLNMVRELKLLNVGVIFEKENINTLTGDGELMLTVLSSFAQEESRSTSENMKWTFKRKFQRGELVINTKRFLGYEKDEYGELVINKNEAKIVQYIFHSYLNGNGMHKIAKELNDCNVPTVTGAIWSSTAIRVILSNEKYKGDAILQKYYTPDNKRKRTYRNNNIIQSYYVKENHPPIVSEEDWSKVQEIIESKRKSGIICTNKYELSGKLICGKCGAKLKRRIINGKKVQWICSRYINEGKKSCSGIRLDDDIVSKLNIKADTIVKEEIIDGKKHYSYSSKSSEYEKTRGESKQYSKKKNGSVLQGINKSGRAVIKL